MPGTSVAHISIFTRRNLISTLSYLGASGLSKLLDVFKIPLEGRFDRFSAIIIARVTTTVTHYDNAAAACLLSNFAPAK